MIFRGARYPYLSAMLLIASLIFVACRQDATPTPFPTQTSAPPPPTAASATPASVPNVGGGGSPVCDPTTLTFNLKWGSFGSGDGQFFYPQGLAVDNLGNVFVSDFDGPLLSRSSTLTANLFPNGEALD